MQACAERIHTQAYRANDIAIDRSHLTSLMLVDPSNVNYRPKGNIILAKTILVFHKLVKEGTEIVVSSTDHSLLRILLRLMYMELTRLVQPERWTADGVSIMILPHLNLSIGSIGSTMRELTHDSLAACLTV